MVIPPNSAGESGSFKMELPWEEVQASSWAYCTRPMPGPEGQLGTPGQGRGGRSSRDLSRGAVPAPITEASR